MEDKSKAVAIIQKAQEDFSSGKISRRDFNSIMMTLGAVAGYTLFNSFASAWTGTRMRKSSGAAVGYQIQRSLRFRASASAYLTRTPASASNRKTYTWSGWLKRGSITSAFTLLSSYSGDENNCTEFYIDSTGYFNFSNVISSTQGNGFWARSSALFRDPSAAYHIVFSVDTTQATAPVALKLYINGVAQVFSASSFGGGANHNTFINNNNPHQVGRASPPNGNYLDGYLSEVNFIDGQVLTPTSFGQYDSSTGQWSPKKYTGTYGTNGYYLDFSDPTTTTTLCTDRSANGNNWTATNISVTAGVTYDSMTDVPLTYGTTVSGNYCTWNPLVTASDATLSNANLTVAYGSSSTIGMTVGTIGQSTGKWYYEFICTATTVYTNPALIFGVVKDNFVQANYPGQNASGWGYTPNTGDKYNNATGTSYGTTGVVNDIFMCAYDVDTGKIWWGKNGTWFASGDPATGANAAYTNLSGNTIFPAIGDGGGASTFTGSANFGQRAFSYTPPTGFKALHTGNFATPAVVKSNQHFDVLLYTAATSDGTYNYGGLNFQPDLVWIKNRNNVERHFLIDVLRGNSSITDKFLVSSDTTVEGSNGISGTTFSVTSNGYQFVESSINTGELFFNGRTYVGWNWKAGGAAVSNTNGSITSQVSANPTSGFSIVKWVGNGSNAQTIGHGLGQTPGMIIHKAIGDSAYAWNSWHKSLATGYYIQLNSTSAADSSVNIWPDTGITSSVFTTTSAAIKYNNLSGVTHVAYCFAEIQGYSKFGSYIGNGSSDGPFVYCGFRPRWIMFKRIDSAANWRVLDTARDINNPGQFEVYPNLTTAEQTFVSFDYISSGFKIRNTDVAYNANGGTYIFAAFAEAPFKYANAR